MLAGGTPKYRTYIYLHQPRHHSVTANTVKPREKPTTKAMTAMAIRDEWRSMSWSVSIYLSLRLLGLTSEPSNDMGHCDIVQLDGSF